MLRAAKTPKSNRFGWKKPVVTRWNNDEQLILWRETRTTRLTTVWNGCELILASPTAAALTMDCWYSPPAMSA